MPNDVVDKTAEAVSGNAAQGKVDEARADLSAVLDEHGFETIDDLKEALSSHSELRTKIGDKNLDDIFAKAETLEKYESYWAEQEAKKREEGETPEQTIARLKKEKQELLDRQNQEQLSKEERDKAKAAIAAYNSEVETSIEQDKDIPKEFKGFAKVLMGIGNPALDVDINNKAAVRKMAKELSKQLTGFAQLVIKTYRDGKLAIPNVSSTDTPAPETGTPPKKQTLQDMRKALHAGLARRR
jgi:hypothetical protein